MMSREPNVSLTITLLMPYLDNILDTLDILNTLENTPGLAPSGPSGGGWGPTGGAEEGGMPGG